MKKFIAIILSLMTALAMSSCSKRINNEFFNEEALKSYALSSDFPAPDVKTTSLMSDANLYVSLDADEYESYSESVYEYLSDNDYYYVGTYKQQGLIAEMMPRYVYEALDSNYDFSSEKHNFTYSPTNDLSPMSDGYCKINTLFVITIERVEDTKYSAFASETYNTIIRLGGNNSIYVSDGQGSVLDGGLITFTANSISSTPIKEEKSFTYKGHEFTYYNVYNDGNGNFVMADNTSYIANNDIQFGLKVKTQFVYKYVEDGDDELIRYTYLDDEGYYNFSIVDFGFVIRGVSTSCSTLYENINIGKIIHWC